MIYIYNGLALDIKLLGYMRSLILHVLMIYSIIDRHIVHMNYALRCDGLRKQVQLYVYLTNVDLT